MSTISNELVKDLRMAFAVWQQDYDPVEDKAQYEMFGLGIVAMDELLALRKERSRAEPVGYRKLFTCSSCGAEGLDEPLESRCHCNGDGARWIEVRLYTAPPAPSIADDSLPYDPQIAEYEQMMEAELKAAARTTYKVKSELSQMAEKLVRDTTELAATLSAENDTEAQEYPETLPCPVILEPNFRLGKGVRTATMLRALQTRAEHQAELDAMTPEELAEYEAGIAAFKSMLSPSSQTTPGERYQQLSELYHAQEKRLFKLAQRIKGPSFDKYSRSPSQAIDVLEAAIFGEDDEDGRTAMLHSVMQPCDKCGLTGIHACMGGMETDTTAQQFESLAGKAVGGSDGFECTPVADLYELLTKCGECYDYTTSAKVAADWIKDGYSAREYVKLDRLQEALVFAAPEPCK